MTEVLVRTITLACSVEHAFTVFTDGIDMWWPRGHRRTRDAALTLTADALVERAPDGTEWTMGRITAIDPPRHLVLDWFPGSPAAPTNVDIKFAAKGKGTEITVVHRALTAAADLVWPQRVATFTQGWDAVLPALKTFIEGD
jgi:uncharacterized protein YndB with AHSA1/START domain